jgi:O-antigen ligase
MYMAVFLVCQSLRILEPVYLHLVDGYWGDATFVQHGEFMDRLSGAPSDTINPNGLAFVIVSVIPFFHYITLSAGMRYRLAYLGLFPIFVYALILTASRSGMVGFGAILFGIFLKSQRKLLLIAVAVIGALIVVANLSDLQQERYLSISRDDVRFSGTAQGRSEGLASNLEVVWNRPICGHGLGTSAEANYHFSGTGLAKPAHNLYLEILQEIGIIGLVIFLVFMKSIIINFKVSLAAIRNRIAEGSYLANITSAMQVWLLMNILFSFASYGLTSYEWYLFAGLSVVVRRLAEAERSTAVSVEDVQWKREFAFSR